MKELVVLKHAVMVAASMLEGEYGPTCTIDLKKAMRELEATLSPRLIEEAPRDGESTFLLLIRDKGVPIWVIGFWDGVEWCHDRVELGALYEEPTHWLPLPSMGGGEK